MPAYVRLVVLLFLLSWGTAWSNLAQTPQNCKKNPLYCHILKLQPKINKQWAMKLSNLLVKYGQQHQLDPWRSLAIAMQESSLIYTKRHQTVMIPIKKCHKGYCHHSLKSVKAISDVGIFQLHVKTVSHYKFNALRLLDDLEYMVVSHYQVLVDKIKQCQHLGKNAWSCYHSRSPVLRKLYVNKVNRYYQKPGSQARS